MFRAITRSSVAEDQRANRKSASIARPPAVILQVAVHSAEPEPALAQPGNHLVRQRLAAVQLHEGAFRVHVGKLAQQVFATAERLQFEALHVQLEQGGGQYVRHQDKLAQRGYANDGGGRFLRSGEKATCVEVMGNREEESSRLEMWMVAFPGTGPIATSCNVTRSSPANTARNFAAAAGTGSKEMTRACEWHCLATRANCPRLAPISTTVRQSSPERTRACSTPPQRGSEATSSGNTGI